jgi:competence protein ComGC
MGILYSNKKKGGEEIMAKKLLIVLAAVLIVALAVPALAATNSAVTPNQAGGSANPALTQDQAREITAIHKQITELRKQMVDKYVKYGQLTSEQGQQIKERINSREQYFEQNPGAFGQGNCPCFSGAGNGPFNGGQRGRGPGPGMGMMGG